MSKAVEEEVKSTAVGANLIEEEKMEIGGVKWEVYSYYAKSIGMVTTVSNFSPIPLPLFVKVFYENMYNRGFIRNFSRWVLSLLW